MKATPKVMFGNDWSFSEETLEKCHARYAGYGCQLYDIIRDQIPTVFSRLRFYQSEIHQAGDSYAICEMDPPFSIQLDPDCEVIVLACETVHTEIGSWSSDPCGEAIIFIRRYFIKTDGEQAAPEQPLPADQFR